MSPCGPRGFTLIEVLIVVVMVAILAAVVMPYALDRVGDSKQTTAIYNLARLRALIYEYKVNHDRPLSGLLIELTVSTDKHGNIGTGAAYPHGPYLFDIPLNPMSDSNVVTAITVSPATAGNVTGTGGWLYNPSTAELWIDHVDLIRE